MRRRLGRGHHRSETTSGPASNEDNRKQRRNEESMQKARQHKTMCRYKAKKKNNLYDHGEYSYRLLEQGRTLLTTGPRLFPPISSVQAKRLNPGSNGSSLAKSDYTIRMHWRDHLVMTAETRKSAPEDDSFQILVGNRARGPQEPHSLGQDDGSSIPGFRWERSTHGPLTVKTSRSACSSALQ